MATRRNENINPKSTKQRLGTGEHPTQEEQISDAFNLCLDAARKLVPSLISELDSEVFPKYKSYRRAMGRAKSRECARSRFPIGEMASWRELRLDRPDVVWPGTALKLRTAIIDWCGKFRMLTTEQYFPDTMTVFRDAKVLPHPLAVEFALSTLEFWSLHPHHRGESYALTGSGGSALRPVQFEWWPDIEAGHEFLSRVRDCVERISDELSRREPRAKAKKDLEHFEWLARFQCTDILLDTLTKTVRRSRIWEQLEDTARLCGIRLRDKTQLRKRKPELSQ